MSNIIIVTEQADRQAAAQGVISLEIAMKRRIQRRRRVAKRLAKRSPLFAVEEMQNEFPGYTLELFEADVTRKTRKGKSFRHIKSPLKRQGRYPLMIKALSKYTETGDTEYLWQAQRLRNNMFLPFEVVFYLPNKKQRTMQFPSTTSFNFIQDLTRIKFSTEEELDAILEKKMEWSHLH